MGRLGRTPFTVCFCDEVVVVCLRSACQSPLTFAESSGFVCDVGDDVLLGAIGSNGRLVGAHVLGLVDVLLSVLKVEPAEIWTSWCMVAVGNVQHAKDY